MVTSIRSSIYGHTTLNCPFPSPPWAPDGSLSHGIPYMVQLARLVGRWTAHVLCTVYQPGLNVCAVYTVRILSINEQIFQFRQISVHYSFPQEITIVTNKCNALKTQYSNS